MAFSSQGLDYAVEKAETTVGWSRPVVDEAHSLGFVGQIEHFGACIDAGTPPMRGARGADGVAVLRIALAAADSAQRGRRIELTASEASC
jgi:predicted dehydrogenase